MIKVYYWEKNGEKSVEKKPEINFCFFVDEIN